MLGEILYSFCLIFLLINVTYGSDQNDLPTQQNLHSGNITNHTVVTLTNSTTIHADIPQSVTTEDLTHIGREIGKVDPSVEVSTLISSDGVTEATPLYIIPSKNDGKSIVPKKGVIFDTTVTDNSTITIPSIVPNETIPIKSSKSDVNHEENVKNYMIPIVAIGFSIPLIGLIVIGVYKLGSEWWQHRHYRKMDFLIEGMYNN